MLDLSKVRKSTVRDAIRNMGWENNESMEDYKACLSELEPLQVMRKWAAWNLGDASWADEFIERYEELKQAQK